MGILSAAFAKGVSGGADNILEQKQEAQDLSEKYAWASEEARIRRDENMAQWDRDKTDATTLYDRGQTAADAAAIRKETAAKADSTRNITEDTASQVTGTSQAKITRKQMLTEARLKDADSLTAKMVALESSPENVKKARDFILAGGDKVAWTGKKGEALSEADAKNLAETIAILLPEETSTKEERIALFDTMEKNRTKGVPGLPTQIKAAEELTASETTTIENTNKLYNGLSTKFSTNPVNAVKAFSGIVSKDRASAEAILSRLEAEKKVSSTDIAEMRKMLEGTAGSGGVMPDPSTGSVAGGLGKAVGSLASNTMDLPKNALRWYQELGKWGYDTEVAIAKGVMEGYNN